MEPEEMLTRLRSDFPPYKALPDDELAYRIIRRFPEHTTSSGRWREVKSDGQRERAQSLGLSGPRSFPPNRNMTSPRLARLASFPLPSAPKAGTGQTLNRAQNLVPR